MNVCSNWIVELGELDATFRKSDLAQLKGFLTKNKDSLRRPYARKESSFARRTVFAGTVNDFHFLHDRAGNRRFWPVDIVSIDRDRSINYQQLWAQIKTFYVAEESWHLSPEEMKQQPMN
jgi:putative DNA primase/helicase